jgi:hypothetical protein
VEIVTREQWGAVPPTGTTTGVAKLQVPTKDLILHHAGSSGGGAARVRAIQRYHMESQGWGDIAYHYLIDSDGTVYEGVGGGIRGAATYGQNLTSHAICLLGNFNTEQPDSRAVGSLVEVIRWGHGEGWWPNQITGGHRDYRSTSCPGDNLYRLIPAINDTVQEEDDMPAPKDWDTADWRLFNEHVTNSSIGAFIGSGSARRTISQAIANTEINVAKVLKDVSTLDTVELQAIAVAVNDELARRTQA